MINWKREWFIIKYSIVETLPILAITIPVLIITGTFLLTLYLDINLTIPIAFASCVIAIIVSCLCLAINIKYEDSMRAKFWETEENETNKYT